MDRWERGLVFCYFGAADSVQHMFWQHLLKDRLLEQGPGSLPAPVIAVYRRMDRIVAEMLERLRHEPRTQVIVLSDHGFQDFRRSVHANRVLLDLGYLALQAGRTEGRSLFQDVDWARTRAYACGFSGIYVNLRGREGKGIVTPAQKQQLVGDLRKQLLAYTDPRGGQRPFAEIHTAAEIYNGPHVGQAPDLIAGCQPGYRFSWQTALGACPPAPIEDNKRKWRGDHIFAAGSVPGVFLSRRRSGEPPAAILGTRAYIMSHFFSQPVRANHAQLEGAGR